jgi:hypothetical protein
MNEPNPFDSEKTHEPWQEECQRLSEKILLGLSSKRSDEEWEHLKKTNHPNIPRQRTL